jgi:hypothetical protein
MKRRIPIFALVFLAAAAARAANPCAVASPAGAVIADPSAGPVYRYLAMPSSWDSPPNAAAPPASGSLLCGILGEVGAMMVEYTDGRASFAFDVAEPHRVPGEQPPGPFCDYGSWNGEVIAAARAAGHDGDVGLFFFPAISGLCPSNTAWATWSAGPAWIQQPNPSDIAHELVHVGLKKDGNLSGIRPHAAGVICVSTPVGGAAFDVTQCHARERGDPTTIMGNGRGRPTFRESIDLGLRRTDQRVTLGTGVARDVTLGPLERVEGIENLSISGFDSTYNLTLRTPVGLDADWARQPRVTIHGYVDGYDAYIFSLFTGDVFLNTKGGFSVTAVSVTNDAALLSVKTFPPPAPDPSLPPPPTPTAWAEQPTPQPQECWSVPGFVRCTPTPGLPTPTPTPTFRRRPRRPRPPRAPRRPRQRRRPPSRPRRRVRPRPRRHRSASRLAGSSLPPCGGGCRHPSPCDPKKNAVGFALPGARDRRRAPRLAEAHSREIGQAPGP